MRLFYFFVFCLLLQNHAYGDTNFNDPFLGNTPNTNGLNPYGSNRFNDPFSGNTPNTNGLNPYRTNRFNNSFPGNTPDTNGLNPYGSNRFNDPFSGNTPNTNGLNPYGTNRFNNSFPGNTPDTNGLNPYGDTQLNTTSAGNYDNDTYKPPTKIPFAGLFILGMIIFFIFKKFYGGEKSDNSSTPVNRVVSDGEKSDNSSTAAKIVLPGGEKSDHSSTPARGGQQYLYVQCLKKNEPIPEQPGRTIELIRVSIEGLAHFAHDNTPITYRVRLIDVTDGEQNLQPILCYIPELSNAEGVFTFDVDAEASYASMTFNNLELVHIPTEALIAPKKGQRRIKVVVGITPPDSVEWFYINGETTINFIQQTYGWMEFQEAVANQESKLAILALCFASIDGAIGKPEAATIKKYFTELYANADNVDTRKQKVNEAMKDTLASLRNKQQQPREVIQRVCDALLRENSAPLSQQAYEICVRVAVADEKLENSEEEMLSYISGKLELAKEFVTEIHDRYISLSTRQHNDDMSIFDILGMPKGLLKEQKLEWIQAQYRKWRNRVTNKDPKVSTEASLMLGMLSKARTQLMAES